MHSAARRAAFRMRPAFSSRAFSVSTNTHSADRMPKTPNVECAKSMTSLPVIFIRSASADIVVLRFMPGMPHRTAAPP